MKKVFYFWLSAVSLASLVVFGQTRSVIRVGSAPNDGAGEGLQTALIKVNGNFSNLWYKTFTNGGGAISGSSFDTNWFSVIGSNVTVAPTVTLTNSLTLNGGWTNSLSQYYVDNWGVISSNAALTAVNNAVVAGDSVSLVGHSSVELLTPAVAATTATVGQVLTLQDATSGSAEWATPVVTGYLPLAGGTMTGAINHGAQFASNIADPVSPQDAVSKNYSDFQRGLWGRLTRNLVVTNTANMVVTDPNVTVVDMGATANSQLTGVTGPTADAKVLILRNASVYAEVMRMENSGSIATNRFTNVQPDDYASYSHYKDVILYPGDCMLIQYDINSLRWVVRGVLSSRLRQSYPTSYTDGGVVVNASNYCIVGSPFDVLRTNANLFKGIDPKANGAEEWKIVEILNLTGSSQTIYNDAATSATFGILTISGSNTSWPSKTSARLTYDPAAGRWRLLATPQ